MSRLMKEYEDNMLKDEDELLGYNDFEEWFKLFGGAISVAIVVYINVSVLKFFI